MEFIDLKAQYRALQGEIDANIQRILAGAHFIGGEEVAEFEEKLAAYVGRKQKKRNFRQLWITRISAACKMNGMNYSNFMHGLKLAGVEINRKMLAEMAVNDKAAFTALTELSKAKLA